MGISEKIAYLKGLMEGMNVDTESNEGKLFAAVVDVLDEIALEVEDLTDEVMELGDGLDVISDDLSDVEDIVYDEWDDDDDDDEDDEEEECYATTCPECEEEIFFDDTMLEDGEIICPNCGAKLSSTSPTWPMPRPRIRTRSKTAKRNAQPFGCAFFLCFFQNGRLATSTMVSSIPWICGVRTLFL